ncbi:ribosome biogenesis GTP-binding protein YihA/YsxC [Mycoplasma crocodyli]|uniref:Probable GTP-binding protein EngB n=1 Tax=Mycoplasma crocodyli (strain ATCC 51981 / MP145) TaxID=512564 RepID=D5E5V3_MYCCM|nr:ribosome biogenesis GTP-binding protein YihA/YsxC [Mycoplasma crocodyli]ADE19811.1 cell division GTP-binding protein EngB [Mycoplasma crocodyli MP145]
MYKFIKSSTDKSNWYDHQASEICFWGRSNVGKSSLLNAIVNNKSLARVSKTPGRTQLLNYFENDLSKNIIVDLPGYGYAKISKSQKDKMLKMIDEYLKNSSSLKAVLLLIDSRHGITNIDREIINYLVSINLPIVLIYTKIDKLNQKEKSQLIKMSKNEFSINKFNYLFVSSQTRQGIDELNKNIDDIFKGELYEF